jgi:glycosyltransferase involved in cell wall biosynthesis
VTPPSPHPERDDLESVTIVVPVLDEAAALPGLLAELATAGVLDRAIFVDNGSRDDSAALIRKADARLLREPRRGYGHACLRGVREARRGGARVVVVMEGDGSDEPRDLARLVRPVAGGACDLMIGSRRAAVRRGARMPLHQRLGEWATVVALRLLFGIRIPDNGPFRAIRGDLLDHLDMEPRSYSWTTEMVVKAHLSGARIGWCETGFRPRPGDSKISGTVRGTVGAAFGIFGSMARLRRSRFPRAPRRAAGQPSRPQ